MNADELRDKISKVIRDRVAGFENCSALESVEEHRSHERIVVELRKLHYNIDGVFDDFNMEARKK